MQTPTALPFLLAQAPSSQPPPPPITQPGVPETGTPPPESGPVGTLVGVTAAVLLVALMVAAARKLFFKRRPELPGKPAPGKAPRQPPPLPHERPELRAELPPSQAELAPRPEPE